MPHRVNMYLARKSYYVYYEKDVLETMSDMPKSMQMFHGQWRVTTSPPIFISEISKDVQKRAGLLTVRCTFPSNGSKLLFACQLNSMQRINSQLFPSWPLAASKSNFPLFGDNQTLARALLNQSNHAFLRNSHNVSTLIFFLCSWINGTYQTRK